MSRFGVYRMGDKLVLDCQADLLSDLRTRVVAPLLPKDAAPPVKGRLNPVFEIGGAQYVLLTEFLTAVEERELGERVHSVADRDTEVTNALDLLLTGF